MKTLLFALALNSGICKTDTIPDLYLSKSYANMLNTKPLFYIIQKQDTLVILYDSKKPVIILKHQ
jgi:hypothetical protein